MKKRRKHLFIICPLCTQEKSADMEISALPKDWQSFFLSYDDPEETFVRKVRSDKGWCCSSCFKTHHGIWAPRVSTSPPIAYFDIHGQCKTCGEPFTATAKHQYKLHETLGMSKYAPIDRCEKCQKAYQTKKNAEKNATKVIGDFLESNPDTIDQLVEISSSYCILEHIDKAELYLRRAKNLTASKNLNIDLIKHLEKARKENHDFDELCQRIITT